MSVDIRLMRYVVAIAEEGSFQRAAARLHMAQPPLSRQIAELERELGVRLFERRPTRLTAAGTTFVDSARKILDDVDRAVARTTATAATVRLGYVVSAAYDVLPRLLAVTAAQSIRVESSEESADLAGGLRDGRFDLALSRSIPEDDDFRRLTVSREPFVAVVGRTHPLAGRSEVSVGDLRGSRLLLSDHHQPAYRDAVLRVVAGIVDDVQNSQIGGWRHTDDLLDGRTVTIVPRTLGDNPPSAGVTLSLTERPPAPDLQLVWLPPASAAATRVIDLAARHTLRR
ncbi:LysR family transcriptional regulator [Fodinicola acaciae]|uniref:LysR family transcriptional regulator n=1 Tax=Fodinicola acaciae TaxID=2681555 RepID=UPI0013D26E8C|nr:LysR family transcriptional regulator [Fodinicola acaciae]